MLHPIYIRKNLDLQMRKNCGILIELSYAEF